MLVTEFIDGYKINELENLKKSGFSLADLNNKLFEAFGHQIFQTGFVHADPHPGNGKRIIHGNIRKVQYITPHDRRPQKNIYMKSSFNLCLNFFCFHDFVQLHEGN